MVILNYN